jgi:hypothetical protein
MRNTPDDVSNAIRAWMRQKKISINDAAVRLEKSPQAVTNALAGQRYMGKKLAADFARVFGFDDLYLTTGYGTLTGEAVSTPAPSEGISVHPDFVRMLNTMTDTIRAQQDSIAAQQENIAQLSRLVEKTIESGKKEDEAPRSATHSAHL